MAWTPLAARLATLPLILAGPVVRRVEARSVTVWVALKEPRTVTLGVYASPDQPAAAPPPAPRLIGTRQTVRLGDHLHVAAVTARAAPDAPPLPWGAPCRYNLWFGAGAPAAVPVPPSVPNLTTPGVLVADLARATPLERLVYGDETLPSLMLPPDDLGQLRIVHGSCRNPGGTGRDALAALDVLLNEARRDGTPRPQQLFCTGDQIYADDVARPLLFALMDAGAALFAGNQEEALSGVNAASRALAPGRRAKVVREVARLTTSTPANHLLTFAEYAAMYLFAWSDALWPSALPAVDDLWGAYPATRPRAGADREREADEHARQCAHLAAFRASLPRVRRALANIATYLICDDHDVTDDWLLDGAWCEHVLGSPLGRQVLRNALAAYALFQGWGNDPVQFAAPHGATFLAAVDAWRGEAEGAHAAAITEALGLPARFNGTGELPRSPHALRWHYTIAGPRHRVVVLDTRTHRQYDHPGDVPGLLSPTAMRAQLADAAPATPASGAAGDPLTFIVSATPVFGVDLIETFQFFSHLHYDNYAFDREAWSLHRQTYQQLVRQLARLRRAVILSGDVHYGFASTLRFWGTGPDDTATLVNFISSSLRNETSAAHKAILSVVYPHLLQLLWRGQMPAVDLYAWDTFAGNTQALHESVEALKAGSIRFWWAAPRLIEILRSRAALVLPAGGWPPGAFANCPPDRRYRLRYLPNSRHPTPGAPAPGAVAPETLQHPDIVALAGTLPVPPALPALPGGQHGEQAHPAHMTLAERALRLLDSARQGFDPHAARDTAGSHPLLAELAQRTGAWAQSWESGGHIVGQANLGEVRMDPATGEAIQALWCWPSAHDGAPAAPGVPAMPEVAAEYRVSLALPAPDDAPALP